MSAKPPIPKAKPDAKKERLEKALRANLTRRKAGVAAKPKA